MQKIIFLSAFQASTVKNLLRTPVIKNLLHPENVRVVCLLPHESRKKYYQKEISHPRLSYEVCVPYTKGWLDRVFGFLKFRMLWTRTQRMRIEKLKLGSPRHNRLVVFAGAAFDRLMALPLVRRVVRFLDYSMATSSDLDPLFDRYNPEVVVLPQLFEDYDIALLRAAKKRGVTTIGYINSWDKITSRCAIRLLPDKLIVFNEVLKREAVEHVGMPPDRIFVCGIPQYDQYVTQKPNSREEFCERYNFDPAKKLLVYAPIGRSFSNSDWGMLDRIYELNKSCAFDNKVEILVRFQPNDFLEESEIAKRPWMKYDKPGVRFGRMRGTDWDMAFADLRHLTNTLAHASVVVCYASSLSVDAAVMGTPVININFEPPSKASALPTSHRKKGTRSPLVYYETEHYSKAFATRGIRLVNSEEELVTWINRYVENPGLDADGRRRLVRQQCVVADGRSGERVAHVILGELRKRQRLSRGKKKMGRK